VTWILDAARVKAQATAAGIPGYLDRAEGRIVVSDYLQATQKITRAGGRTQPDLCGSFVTDKDGAASDIRHALRTLYAEQEQLAPVAEAVLQAQVAEVAADFGLATLGQPIPPVLYRGTAVPDALIISPRREIRQSANISIKAGLPVDQHASLESTVELALDASALVVPVGGVGVYPT